VSGINSGLVDVSLSPRPFYLVVGWKVLSRESLVAAFVQSKSSTPCEDVERALGLLCPAIQVWLLDEEDYEEQGKKYLEEYERVGVGATNYEPPVVRRY